MNFPHKFLMPLACLITLLSCGHEADNSATVSSSGVRIEIPNHYFPIQTTNWSCGPNSVARLLNVLGLNVQYEEVKAYAEPLIPHINLPSLGIDKMLGSSPELVADLLKHWAKNTKPAVLKGQVNGDVILQELAKGNPVLTLIQSGTDKTVLGDAPILHWVMITGYDFFQKKYQLSDPGYGNLYWETRESFEKRWFWQLPSNGLLNSAYRSMGYTPATLVKIN